MITKKQDIANQEYSSSKQWMIIIGVAAVVLGITSSILVTRSITRPLNRALTIAEAVAEGNLNHQIEVLSEDETGQLMAALQTMVDNLKIGLRKVHELREKIYV